MRIVERAQLGRKIAVSALLAGVCVTLVHLAPEPRPEYKMADEVAERLDEYEGKPLRVHGYVVPGSITESAPGVHDYIVARNGHGIRARYRGVLPDTFKDQSEVVQDGNIVWTPQGYVIDGATMHTKCGGKYEGATPDRTAKFQ